MTFRQKLQAGLEERGLFDSEASDAITAYEQSNEGAPMRGRLDDAMEGYGPDGDGQVIFTTITLAVDDYVIAWMDREKPEHWARGLFSHT